MRALALIGAVLFVTACGGSDDTDPQDSADGGVNSVADSGRPITSDGGGQQNADGGMQQNDNDAGMQNNNDDAGTNPACIRAQLLFEEDFESGTYDGFTGNAYDFDPSDCNTSAIVEDRAVSGTRSTLGRITCAKGDSHRGYGGVQFSGDTKLENYTNQGQGIDAPYGVVNTYWSWLDAGYFFDQNRWYSNFTVNGSCDYSERVIALGASGMEMLVGSVHITMPGGTITYAPNAPGLPRQIWSRTTIYVNYVDGEMTFWVDGAKVFDATFDRESNRMCQFHWGLYASGANDDVTLYEDDISMWKLEEPLLDRDAEPWMENTLMPCP